MTTSIRGPIPTGWKAFGVDLSANNTLKPAHWDFLQDHGCGFAILRASHDITGDAAFAVHAQHAQARGIAVGAYMLLRPESEAPVVKQVDLFLTRVRFALERPFLLAVDIEGDWTAADDPKRCMRRALWLILKATGHRPYIYTYSWFYKRWLSGPILRTFPLWGAAYPPIGPDGKRVDVGIEFATAAFGRPVALWQYGGNSNETSATGPAVDKNVIP